MSFLTAHSEPWGPEQIDVLKRIGQAGTLRSLAPERLPWCSSAWGSCAWVTNSLPGAKETQIVAKNQLELVLLTLKSLALTCGWKEHISS